MKLPTDAQQAVHSNRASQPPLFAQLGCLQRLRRPERRVGPLGQGSPQRFVSKAPMFWLKSLQDLTTWMVLSWNGDLPVLTNRNSHTKWKGPMAGTAGFERQVSKNAYSVCICCSWVWFPVDSHGQGHPTPQGLDWRESCVQQNDTPWIPNFEKKWPFWTRI